MSLIKTVPVTQKFLLERAKRLQVGWNRSGGRNNTGRITSYKKGPFKFRRVYKFIDFWRRLTADAFIVAFERDNFRTSTLALIFYQTGYLAYVILPEGLALGDKLKSFDAYLPNLSVEDSMPSGVALPLSAAPDGSTVFNIEL